jgi:hypothetical protein
MVFCKNYLMQDLLDIHEIPVSPLEIEVCPNDSGIAFKKCLINQVEEGFKQHLLTALDSTV